MAVMVNSLTDFNDWINASNNEIPSGGGVVVMATKQWWGLMLFSHMLLNQTENFDEQIRDDQNSLIVFCHYCTQGGICIRYFIGFYANVDWTNETGQVYEDDWQEQIYQKDLRIERGQVEEGDWKSIKRVALERDATCFNKIGNILIKT